MSSSPDSLGAFQCSGIVDAQHDHNCELRWYYSNPKDRSGSWRGLQHHIPRLPLFRTHARRRQEEALGIGPSISACIPIASCPCPAEEVRREDRPEGCCTTKFENKYNHHDDTPCEKVDGEKRGTSVSQLLDQLNRYVSFCARTQLCFIFVLVRCDTHCARVASAGGNAPSPASLSRRSTYIDYSRRRGFSAMLISHGIRRVGKAHRELYIRGRFATSLNRARQGQLCKLFGTTMVSPARSKHASFRPLGVWMVSLG